MHYFNGLVWWACAVWYCSICSASSIIYRRHCQAHHFVRGGRGKRGRIVNFLENRCLALGLSNSGSHWFWFFFPHCSSGSYRPQQQQQSVPRPSKNRPVLTLQSFLTPSKVSLWLPLIPLVSWLARVSIGIDLGYVRMHLFIFCLFSYIRGVTRMSEIPRCSTTMSVLQLCKKASKINTY